MNTAIAPFRFSCAVAAPSARVWPAWTDADALRQWFGPKGFATITAVLDFRPGGRFHYCLRSPEGREIWGKLDIQKLQAAHQQG